MTRLAMQAAHLLAILAIACLAVYTTSLLPITDPATASGVCILAGTVAGFLADVWLPCPCHQRRPR